MPSRSILRRVKPALHDDSDEEDFRDGHEHDEGQDDDEAEYEEMKDYDDDDENSDGDSEDDNADETDPTTLLSQTSFGTLARAESSIGKDRSRAKAGSQSTSSTSKADRISAVKSQLQALKSTSTLSSKSKATGSNKDPIAKPDGPRKSFPPPKRLSKSAPAEQSSKKPVSRYREAIEVNIPKSRDPRFDLAAGTANETQFKKNYAFLKGYKEVEMTELKEEVKMAKKVGANAEEIERVLKRMESQKQTQEAKDRTAALLAEHKKKERELIKQGKMPYFLKRSEQKKMVLLDKYSKLGEKQLDRVLARKRKHKAAKERKKIPWARRGTEA